ncbi:MAG: hypothetical protein HXX81_07455 [Campylobacterales bacterium]|nr:hypothetical protein [Campylobacterales bacterium]
MIDFERVKKECFWDLDISDNDILDILRGDDFRKKGFLFEKILSNSTKLFEDLRMFSESELKILLENFKIPSFNGDYLFKRKNFAEVYFF